MDSMEEIYMKHGKMIYGFLLTRTRDPGLAEELTQETFYQAVKHIGGYKGESSISTWLCAIAKNLWRDYLRRQKDQMYIRDSHRGDGAQPHGADQGVQLLAQVSSCHRAVQDSQSAHEAAFRGAEGPLLAV